MKGRKLKNCSWLSVWGAVALTLGASAVYILIIANAQRLNYFFFPTLFLHFFCIFFEKNFAVSKKMYLQAMPPSDTLHLYKRRVYPYQLVEH